MQNEDRPLCVEHGDCGGEQWVRGDKKRSEEAVSETSVGSNAKTSRHRRQLPRIRGMESQGRSMGWLVM